jgi:hypothetical protein
MAKSGYPEVYGHPVKGALPDIIGPLNIEGEGDRCAPPNDMAELGLADGRSCPDPMGFITPIQGKDK